MESILVISDEPALAETLASEISGYKVQEAPFKEASAALHKEKFCLIITDDVPSALTDELRESLAVHKSMTLGLSRPVRLSDLLYTIHARLQGKTAGLPKETALAEGWMLLPAERLLESRDGKIRIALTEKEVEIVLCLLKEGKQITREKLLKTVWGYSDDIATHTLETHIYRLRGKLRQANESFDIVFSEEGGYRLATGGFIIPQNRHQT